MDSFKAKYSQQTEQVDSIDQIMSKYRKPQSSFESEYDKIKRKYLVEKPIEKPPSPIPEIKV